MSNGFSTAMALALAFTVSMLLGAIAGFFIARLFSSKGCSIPEMPGVPETPADFPIPAVPPMRHIVEAELSDSEIDALPAELPPLDRPVGASHHPLGRAP